MSKEDVIEVEGIVAEALPNGPRQACLLPSASMRSPHQDWCWGRAASAHPMGRGTVAQPMSRV